jgi:hypothetical protein
LLGANLVLTDMQGSPGMAVTPVTSCAAEEDTFRDWLTTPFLVLENVYYFAFLIFFFVDYS